MSLSSLSSLRPALTRLLPRYVRTMATGNIARDSSTYDEAMKVFGGKTSSPPATSQGESSLLAILEESVPAVEAEQPTTSTPVSNPGIDLDHMHLHIPPPTDPLLHFFSNCIMEHGKAARARKATHQMLVHIYAMTRSPPMPIFTQAVMEAAPAVRMRSIKKGGKSIQAPMALSERQRIKRGITWIVEASKKKPGKTVSERVAREVIAVLRGQSSVLETKTKSHQLAMVNRGVLPKR
ncbi:ribosomal protein S7 domain-containing protein [Panaeolus papilionaceus]|nr:ribosomal protein S7 domain-containing protein [Panaeolus papilionaceus]